MRLLKVPLFDDEVLNSFASRTARANGRSSLGAFFQDFAIRSDRFVLGNSDEVLKFAALIGVPKDGLLARRLVVKSDKSVSSGENSFSQHQIVRTKFRFCARCLKEDRNDEARMPGTRQYGRMIWLLPSVRTCRQHGTSISEIPAREKKFAHDFCSLAESHSDLINRESERAVDRKASGFEMFVADRVSGEVQHAEFA